MHRFLNGAEALGLLSRVCEFLTMCHLDRHAQAIKRLPNYGVVATECEIDDQPNIYWRHFFFFQKRRAQKAALKSQTEMR